MKRPRWAQLYEESQQLREQVEQQETVNKHLISELNLLRLHTMQHEALLRGKVGVTEEEFTVALSEILRGKPKEAANSESIPASDANRPLSELETAQLAPEEAQTPSAALSTH